MTRAIIVGAGGTGRDIVDWLPELAAAGRPLEVQGFLDDDPEKQGMSINGIPVVGTLAALATLGDVKLIDALGSSRTHRDREGRWNGIPSTRFLTVVHPLARVSAQAQVAEGCLIYPFTFIGPDVRIERQVQILSHGVVNHDARIDAFAILASKVALGGGAHVGTSAYVGMGAVVREGRWVGAGAMVGMGSVVTTNVLPGTTVMGNPARPKE
jgi:sugar O-acyltransferase (sialic acid O-acetyltransferase NeuD family)